MEPLGSSAKRNVGSGGGPVMCGGLVLSCCFRNRYGHELVLKDEEEEECLVFVREGRIFFRNKHEVYTYCVAYLHASNVARMATLTSILKTGCITFQCRL